MPAAQTEQLARFHRLFAPPMSHTESSLESMADAAETASLSVTENQDRMERTGDQLDRIVRDYLNNDSRAHDIVRKIRQEGGEALNRLGAGDASLFDQPDAAPVLEVIVASDGSRPTFLIQDGRVDQASSILGNWKLTLDQHASQLNAAIECVGRIDVPGVGLGYTGTGFLVHRDLVVTNRHVLQTIGAWDGTKWQLAAGVAFDFGHELAGRSTHGRRAIDSVAFAGSRAVNPFAIDHSVLDLVVLKLQPSDNAPDRCFRLSTSQSWLTDGNYVCTIGYPGPPPSAAQTSLLDQLFQSHFGYKRLAPGLLMAGSGGTAPWTVAHDATTLGGNSGSVIISLSADGFATGLHYGGKWSAPRENWGHVLADCLEELDQATQKALREILAEYDVFAGPSHAATQPPAEMQARPVTGSTDRGMQPGRLTDPAVQLVSTPKPAPTRAADTKAGKAIDNGRGQRQRVTLSEMRFLGLRPGATRLESMELEAAGDGETPASELQDRPGYNADFLPGWTVALPMPQGDMRGLRRGGQGVELRYQHFSVIMSQSRRLPILTATNVDGGQSRRVPRIDSWRYDGRLDKSDQWGNELYSNNQVDRGHMVRREDPVWGSMALARRANVDTFHYTNSCPQMAGVNQRVWLGLEDHILKHVREDSMRVSVFTGPYFSDEDFLYRGALIPLAFWKIVAFQLDDNRPSATAYEVSQSRELSELEFVFGAYQTFQISIQSVMDRTGIDFSELVPFDGFSTEEAMRRTRVVERLEQLSQIRV